MFQYGAGFCPFSIESLGIGLWLVSRLDSESIALKSMTFTGTILDQALRNVSEQSSVKLWEYNAKSILRRIALEHDLAFWDVCFFFFG